MSSGETTPRCSTTWVARPSAAAAYPRANASASASLAKRTRALAVAHRVGDLAAPAVVQAHREPCERGVARRARPEVDPERVRALCLLVGRSRGLGQRQQALARRLGAVARMREARPEVA